MSKENITIKNNFFNISKESLFRKGKDHNCFYCHNPMGYKIYKEEDPDFIVPVYCEKCMEIGEDKLFIEEMKFMLSYRKEENICCMIYSNYSWGYYRFYCDQEGFPFCEEHKNGVGIHIDDCEKHKISIIYGVDCESNEINREKCAICLGVEYNLLDFFIGIGLLGVRYGA